MLNRDNVLVHEWIGLKARVSKSSCRAMEGLSGTIIDETRNTVALEGPGGQVKRVPKKSCTFEIEIGPGWVSVDGSSVCYAPEDRPKKLMRTIR